MFISAPKYPFLCQKQAKFECNIILKYIKFNRMLAFYLRGYVRNDLKFGLFGHKIGEKMTNAKIMPVMEF